jgi:hypothetical protein
MTAMSDATSIHLTSPPVACAACYAQYPDRQHVDFGATYDGPVLNQLDVISTGVTNVQIDELIICDKCVSDAAALLGLKDPGKMKAQIDELVARVEDLSERLAGAMALIDAKEKAEAKRASLLAEMKG